MAGGSVYVREMSPDGIFAVQSPTIVVGDTKEVDALFVSDYINKEKRRRSVAYIDRDGGWKSVSRTKYLPPNVCVELWDARGPQKYHPVEQGNWFVHFVMNTNADNLLGSAVFTKISPTNGFDTTANANHDYRLEWLRGGSIRSRGFITVRDAAAVSDTIMASIDNTGENEWVYAQTDRLIGDNPENFVVVPGGVIFRADPGEYDTYYSVLSSDNNNNNRYNNDDNNDGNNDGDERIVRIAIQFDRNTLPPDLF